MPLGLSYLQNLNLRCNITLITIASIFEWIPRKNGDSEKNLSDAKSEQFLHEATQPTYKTCVSLSLQEQEATHLTYSEFVQSNCHVTWLYLI